MRAKFINEEYVNGSLFRSTDQMWLRIFLDQDKIMYPKNKEGFISLSFDTESGSIDSFGGKEVTIEFDQEMIFNQDAIELYYEPEFFEKYPKLCLYITGYEGEEDYYNQKDYKNAEEAISNLDLTWEDVISDFEHEDEVVMTKLKYIPGIIKKVIIYNKLHPILKDMLEENNINYIEK
jgi:hypothetical protein